MNDFEVKKIKEASIYLKEKLDAIKKEEDNIFALKNKKKDSPFKKLVNSFFKS